MTSVAHRGEPGFVLGFAESSAVAPDITVSIPSLTSASLLIDPTWAQA